MVNWDAAWMTPWRAVGEPIWPQTAPPLELHAALNQALAHRAAQRDGVAPITFAPQSSLPHSTAYERFIFETRTVPTRDNLHDFFNGLAWLLLPQTKAVLNRQQHLAITRDGIGGVRGRLRDAATVFDENGAVLLTDGARQTAMVTAWQRRDWSAVFGLHRALWSPAPVLFGHALLEKLQQPRKAITAHVLIVPCADAGTVDSLQALDAVLAPALDSALNAVAEGAPKPFLPLPVLGVPRWWPDNEDPRFYDDAAVFRPARTELDRNE
jgi:Protein of unknown function (DUF3025)